MNRQDLEAQALQTVSALNYYDLVDYIDNTSDSELIMIINSEGAI